MIYKIKALLILSLSLIFVLFSCSSKREIKKSSDTIQPIQTGYWNNSDSRTVSDYLVKNLLNDRWLAEYMNVHKNLRPILIVGNITNSGTEIIDTLDFIKEIERTILKVNSTRLIQTINKRKDLNSKIKNLSDYDCSETIINWAKEQGADFLINGKINSVPEIIKRKKQIHYHIKLELINIETKQLLWIGEKTVTKQIDE